MFPFRNNKIKVMAVVPNMRTGGAERVVSLLLQNLDRRRFIPQLATVFDPEAEYEIPADVPVFPLTREPPVEVVPAPVELPQGFGDESVASLAWLNSMAATLAAVVSREQPDVVLSTPLWASLIVGLAHDDFPPSTKWIHREAAIPSTSVAAQPVNGDLFAYIMRRRFNRADRVIAVSRAAKKDLAENFAVDPERIVVLRNPVDVAAVGALAETAVEDPWFAERIPVLLSAGRLERVKGLEYLLRAIATVVDARPVRCIILGDGSQRDYLMALAKHLGIAEHVRFAGRQSNPFKFMRRATAFVLPSLSEGMPNVLIEAMACGCPVIASDIPGGITREVLREGEFGLIVPSKDADALAAAIIRMLDDDDLRRKLKSSGFKRAAAFDVPVVMRGTQKLLRKVARAKDRRRGPRGSWAVLGDGSDGVSSDSADEQPAVEVKPESPTAELSDTTPQAEDAREAGFREQDATAEAAIVCAEPADRPRRESGEYAEGASVESGKLRLAVLVPSMDHAYMGTGTEVMLKYLDRQQFEVSLISINECLQPDGVPEDVAEYIVEATPDAEAPLDASVPAEIADKYRDQLVWMSGVADGLSALLGDLSIGALLAQGHYASIVAAMAKQRMGRPPRVVASIHSSAADLAEPGYGGDLYTALLRAKLGEADIVLAPNERIREDLVEEFGAAGETVTLMVDPIDAAPAGQHALEPRIEHPWFGGDGPVFLVICGSQTESGLSTLLRAIALAQTREPVRCLVAGDGARLRESRDLATELGVDSVVDFLGEETSPWRLMHGSTGLVHVDVDGQVVPLSIIDAVAAGCPVIATRSSEAVSEFLGQGRRGVLVAPNAPAALADALLQVFWDDDASREMARRAAEFLDSVSATSVVPRLERLIKDSVREDEGLSQT